MSDERMPDDLLIGKLPDPDGITTGEPVLIYIKRERECRICGRCHFLMRECLDCKLLRLETENTSLRAQLEQQQQATAEARDVTRVMYDACEGCVNDLTGEADACFKQCLRWIRGED